MPAINKSFGLSSSLEEEVMVVKNQGIVSILGYSDSEKTKSPAAASLRRTLSADMSSQKWLSQNGFNSPLKRIASSEEFPVSSPDVEDDDRPNQLDIWNSIQQKNKEAEKGQFDIWSSIVSNKKESETNNAPAPYVHPLVKRSASLLSEKSLQICTESLGSETGSDGFSSYPASETEEEQQGEEEEKEPVKFEQWEEPDFPVEKYSKKAAPKSFPPPLASLSRGDGASLHMRPRRDNGRLVLEAVTVPPQNNFRAERQDGRLVLTFINNEKEETMAEEKENNDDVDMFKVEIDDSDSDEENEIEEEEMFEKPILVPKAPNFHRLALMMNKSFVNMNPKWPTEFETEEEVVNLVKSVTPINPMRKWPKEFEIEEEIEEEVIDPVKPVNSVNPIVSMTQSLPPRPPMGRVISRKPGPTGQAIGSLNAYEYYWKVKRMVPTSAALVNPLAQNPTISKNIMANEKITNKRGNYLVPLSSKGCKEPKTSLLFWEPYCIATS